MLTIMYKRDPERDWIPRGIALLYKGAANRLALGLLVHDLEDLVLFGAFGSLHLVHSSCKHVDACSSLELHAAGCMQFTRVACTWARVVQLS